MAFWNLMCWGSSKPPKSIPPTNNHQANLVGALKATRADIQKICTISGVAGLSISVIDHGETIYQDNMGYRDLVKKEPVTSDTIFHNASLTKSFTGTCISQLRAQGKLKPDDLIKELLPDIKSRDPAVATSATVADLLGHRTGRQKADITWLGSDGELLLNRDQTLTASLRSQFVYNNICYALLGDIITKLTGQPYHDYLKENILDPLGMSRSIVTKDNGLPDNSSLAYSTLDNREPYNVPLPASSASVAMEARKESFGIKDTSARFDDISWLFTPLQIMEIPIFREKSYAAGWARSQLPTTVGDIGVNPGLVEAMPLLADGINSRLALWHQGSLVGATSFIMMLPETETAVLVLTNTMALNDAADWIGQLLIETLLGSPVRNDYAHLASASADRALQKGRKKVGGPDRALGDYVGLYAGFGGALCIKVIENGNRLDMLFQERESQKYQLHHHHDDTFTWFTSWNEQIKRARFIVFSPAFYSIHFKSEGDKGIIALNWVSDAAILEGEDFVKI
ncbi:beta-lactamase/transpeptidase-like protein [Xylogone sp. PMI_703]|nr:beta-lactamase/transpeptidase-like protein [Xylogone sp. PMI_703]